MSLTRMQKLLTLFKNHLTSFKKHPNPNVTSKSDIQAATTALSAKVFDFSDTTPRNLFIDAERVQIEKRALTIRPQLDNNNGAAFRRAAKELWDEADQEKYIQLAAKENADVGKYVSNPEVIFTLHLTTTCRHQKQFSPLMHHALKSIAQSRALGEVEFVFLFSMLDPDSGDVQCGRYSASVQWLPLSLLPCTLRLFSSSKDNQRSEDGFAAFSSKFDEMYADFEVWAVQCLPCMYSPSMYYLLY